MGLILAAIAILFLMAVIGVTARRQASAATVVYGGSTVACILLLVWALGCLTGTGSGGVGSSQSSDYSLVLPIGLPWLGMHLRGDFLSAVFVLVIAVGGITSSIYGWGYERAHSGHAAPNGITVNGGPVLPLFPLFIAGMTMVVVADDAFTFLVSWEFMSLSSWLLVLSTHRESETPQAARLYLIMASFGTLCLLLAFGVMSAGQGDHSFAAIREHRPEGVMAGLTVILMLLGAGSKAGMVPLHVWLPLAHPAAPSHVSALMSGVMTKIAVYALIRVLFDLLGEPAWWWGAIMLGFGAITAVLGVLYALMQDDIKRLLAYSTVENIGAIILALGLALVFKASHTPVIAALALAAALLHVVNHSLFKTLLFYVAGAVLSATGSRNLDQQGGLIHLMPATAFLALIGASAISALPPLNGFVGEWLLFQAIFNGPALPQWSLKIGIAVVGAALALATALAAACFVRFYGIVFLGRPRSPQAADAHEVNHAMRLGMVIPAVLCVILGVLPTPLLLLFEPAIRGLVEAGPFDDQSWQSWFWLAPTSAVGNSYNGFIMVIVIAILSILLVTIIHRIGSARVRRSIPWGCGFEGADPAAVSQYTGSSFAQPIRRIFGSWVFRARDEVYMPEPGDPRPARLVVHLIDPAWTLLFKPIGRMTGWIADRANTLQFLTIRRYLAMMFAALVMLLVLVAITQN